MTHPLDNPVWHATASAPESLVRRAALASRFLPDVSVFAAVADEHDPASWDDLAGLVEAGSYVVLVGLSGPASVPAGWDVLGGGEGVQMVDTAVDAQPYPEAVELGGADVPEILDLVARTKPGPFASRTIEVGRYLGVRRDGALVAMAGERLRPPGWTEISAVCTDAAVRGQGLASRLVRAVAHGIKARGDTPMLHAADSNQGAIRLYEALGFRLRRRTTFYAVRRAAA